jgi:hypothetical protein
MREGFSLKIKAQKKKVKVTYKECGEKNKRGMAARRAGRVQEVKSGRLCTSATRSG